jgi:hypothetical protein
MPDLTFTAELTFQGIIYGILALAAVYWLLDHA